MFVDLYTNPEIFAIPIGYYYNNNKIYYIYYFILFGRNPQGNEYLRL